MNHQKLVDSAKKFLDVSTYREVPTQAKPFVEPRAIVESRIDDAISHLDKMSGYSILESENGEIPSDVNSELSKFSQGKTKDCCGEVVYTGTANTGVKYSITQKSATDFVVSFIRPNGGKADIATYPTAQGALYMLQAQVPNIIPEKDDITVTPIVDSTPIDVHSFDSMHEETQLTKAIGMVLGQIGISSLESLNEDTQKEIISIATDIAPHI